jgi:hypothetical protein
MKDLWKGNFGQKRAKHGVRLQMQILKVVSIAGGSIFGDTKTACEKYQRDKG